MKIGLIAMSGIRACDAELLRLGLTLPGFVERSKTIASLPSLGLLTLAALTPFLLYGWFQSAIGAAHLRIDPTYSGGEISHVIERLGYRI